MNIEEEAEMCRKYHEHLAGKLPSGWSITFIGLVDRLRGGAQKHGIMSGFLCVKAAGRSKLFAEGLSVCVGIGKPDGKKLDPAAVAGLLHESMQFAEQQRTQLRQQLGGRR